MWPREERNCHGEALVSGTLTPVSRRADLARSCCIGLFFLGCGGGGGAAEPLSWPPASLGGDPPDLGPTFDPQIEPETNRIYPDYPTCDGASRALRERERIELNGGDYVDARRLARWEGSPRCASSRPTSHRMREQTPWGPRALKR